MNRARFLKVLFQMVLILVGGGVRIGHAAARDTSWTAFHAGDNVEVDAVCGGMWQRVTILKIEPIAGEITIDRVQEVRDGNHRVVAYQVWAHR